MERDYETSGSRVAIITGAASKRGMGRATALRLASSGIRVVVTDLTTDGDTQLIDEVVSEIRDSGGEAIGLPLDVMDTENVEQAVNRVVEEWGHGQWRDVSTDMQNAPHEANLLRLDCTKAATLLRWKPAYSLDRSLRETVAWYHGHQFDRGFDASDYMNQQIDSYVKAAVQSDVCWAVSDPMGG